jgi:hypothetical protein
MKGMDDVLKKYHDSGIRVVPYTNGHLFDTQTSEWQPNLA